MSTICGKTTPDNFTLQPFVVEAPFQQWGLDFIGEFKENSSNGFKWILTCTITLPGGLRLYPQKGNR
jgi:hypothetical protein